MAIRPDKISYINHLGESINFGEFGLYLDQNSLRDYSWEPIIKGKKIVGFSRDAKGKPFDFLVASPDYFNNHVDLRDKLFEITEKDVLAKKHGRIVMGSYYFSCYVIASEKYTDEDNPTLMGYTLTPFTDKPYWVAERTHSFRKTEIAGDDNLDYPYDYPYDYYSGAGSQRVVNAFFAPVDFRMVIYGGAVNPSINIGGHVYKVNTTVEAGEYLTIDSVEKTIVLTQNNGTKINKFDYRDRTSYIFEPIAAGSQPVSWLGDFGFDITLLEKRSEPPWT